MVQIGFKNIAYFAYCGMAITGDNKGIEGHLLGSKIYITQRGGIGASALGLIRVAFNVAFNSTLLSGEGTGVTLGLLFNKIRAGITTNRGIFLRIFDKNVIQTGFNKYPSGDKESIYLDLFGKLEIEIKRSLLPFSIHRVPTE
jgi:hypothetical protein